jgi:preprotein translocase subunit SecA
MSLLKTLLSFGTEEYKLLKRFKKRVAEINALEPQYKGLSDADLKGKTQEFKSRLATGETLDDILPEAFALVREASRRTLNERHYDVQLIGGQVLHHGAIAEMRTGEGKTLVATLPAYLNALTGKGVHVITVNDYLSRRDAVWMAQVYDMLGLSTAVINHESSFLYDPTHVEKDKERDEVATFKVVYEFLRPCTRKEAYAADITYGTNNEFGFDYLRDNIAYNKEQIVQRDFNFAIVDEVDSILIDEARTPLIISAPSVESEDLYKTCAKLAEQLIEQEHYVIDEKRKAISLTDSGINKAEELLGVENIYTEKGIKFVYHIETAVKAKAIYLKDRDYVVRNGEVVIVDEFTGRMQPGRRWSDGIHQAVEAKERVPVQKESRTLASITFQNYFRFYSKLSGMTGTAETSAEEFEKVYNVPVVKIPTHRQIQRIDRPDLIFQTEAGKFKAIARKVKELNEKGQPVLVGTASIDKNELLAEYFKREQIPFEMLNAKNHEREGEVIAQAGKKGGVFLATNMAGRGVDIKLGGLPRSKETEEEVKALGGLYVLGTERHEARRIDNQLRGRSGRQGDPGETQFFVSLEDHLMRVFSPDTMKWAMSKAGVAEDEPLESKLISRSIESAQKKIEGLHFDNRKAVLQYDDVLNQQRKSMYERRKKILLGEHDAIDAFLETLAMDDELSQTLQAIKEKSDEKQFYSTLRSIILQTMDMLWMDHLELMEYTRNAVGLRQIGQRDPYVEYKKEGLRLFREMEHTLKAKIIEFIPNLTDVIKRLHGASFAATPVYDVGNVQENYDNDGQGVTSAPAEVQKHFGGKVLKDVPGRNDPCPCGNGKKWKKCGESDPEHCEWVKAQQR